MVLQLLKTSHVFFGNLSSVVVFTRAHWHSYTLFISLKFILISASHRFRGIQRCIATLRVQFNIFAQNPFLFFACYTPSSHHPHRLYHTNSIWWRTNTVKLLTVLFSPVHSRSYCIWCSRTHAVYTFAGRETKFETRTLEWLEWHMCLWVRWRQRRSSG
jgi:hypothetical protein